MQTYSIEHMVNGLYLVTQRGSGLVAVYNEDGSYRHGVRFSNSLDTLALMGKVVKV